MEAPGAQVLYALRSSTEGASQVEVPRRWGMGVLLPTRGRGMERGCAIFG